MQKPDKTTTGSVQAAARELQGLAPGPLAELRRMNGTTGSPMFWRLAARYPQTIGLESRQDEWIAILRILAILTEKGDPANRKPLHDPKRPLGEVLCDGGSRDNWSEKNDSGPRPVFSERRFIQLMSARGTQRAVLLERAARALARSRDPGSGINVVDIAQTVLRPDDNIRWLAEPYYKKLDRAEKAVENSGKGTE